MTITAHLITNRETWHNILQSLPYAHILQTWEWGELKRETTGWTAERFHYMDSSGNSVAAVSLLTRKVGFLRVMYAPKGAVLDYTNDAIRDQVLAHLEGIARQRYAIWLKLDPDVPLQTGFSEDDSGKHPVIPNPTGMALKQAFESRGWHYSDDQVQFPNTVINDLSLSVDDLLKGMNQSTRRKLRQADKNGVQVRHADLAGADLEILYDLYANTSQRQGFLIRPLSYYKLVWQRFAAAGMAHALIAEVNGDAAAGAVYLHTGQKVWFFYGMTTTEHRNTQANYALHWQAIQWAKEQGYPLYDWWGAPTQFEETDPLWGVFRFKNGFGGQVVQHIGAWDYIPYPWLYRVYEGLLPRILNSLRRLRQ